MKKAKKYIHQLLKDESGQGTTEYILIVVGIVGLVLVASRYVGGEGGLWSVIQGKLTGAIDQIQ